MIKTPRPGTKVNATTPRGPVKAGRFVATHYSPFGIWWEIAPIDANGRTIKDAATFRARPASVTVQ